ncbi:11077_t:CDS:2, partial [Paraglomus occultum]
PNVLAHVDADQLELWKADTPFGVKPSSIQSLPATNNLLAIHRISDYWPGEIPPNSIHVLINPARLSESDLLELCPPCLGYINRHGSTGSTRFQYARTPGSVVTWHNFENDVKNATWDDTRKYPSHPAFQQYLTISDEETIRQALDENVFRFLNNLLSHEVFGRFTLLKSVIGEPDFIQKDSNEVLRLVIEVKTKWALSADNLVTTYAQNLTECRNRTTSRICVYHQLKQVFGYLSHNHLQFGVLTTYDKTWFLYRRQPDELCISPPIQYNNQQPTLFQCFFYLTFLARNKPDCDSAPQSPQPLLPDDDNGDSSYDDGDNSSHNDGGRKRKASSQDARRSSQHRVLMAGRGRSKGGRGSKGGKRNKVMAHPSHSSNREEEHVPLEFFDWGSFRVLNVLGMGCTGTVFKAILHGEQVALKICDLWQHPDYEKELLNEVEVYNALKDLQGDCVPRFKGAGYTAGGLFTIATDIVGRPLEDAESLSDQEYLVIRTALSSIHHYGFVHNDIHRENILVKRTSHQFYASFIDFAFSKQGCQHDFQKEMKSLARLLRQS